MKKIVLGDNVWGDDRGWGVNLLSATGLNSESIGDLHVVSVKPGKVRGNHYHETSTEWLLFLGGKAKLVWRELGREITHEVEIYEPGPTLYIIPPKFEHAVINVGRHDMYLSSLSDREERGTFRSVDLFAALEDK